jgi:glycosyltransferase involved in cell wall biosynthesis
MRILLYTDLRIQPKELFWHRDLGLLTKAFRELGHDAWLVVHPTTKPTRNLKPATRNGPVIWASASDVRSPSWWRLHKPDLVILGLWTRPKYDPVRRAALAATPRVIERADSDGMRTASCGLKIYARRRYDYFRDRTYRWPAPLSIPASALYSLASILATPWIEARLAQTLKLLPAVAIETPHATALWKGLAAKTGADPFRIHCIPHPIQTDIFKRDPAVPKKDQIISVGRWESYQKNLPLLVKTLTGFLKENPSWKALIVGSGLPQTPPHSNILLSAALSPTQLARQMQESKFFLAASRYESFGLAAAEAQACGCTILDANLLTPFVDLSKLASGEMRKEFATTAWHAKDVIFSLDPREIANGLLQILPRSP